MDNYKDLKIIVDKLIEYRKEVDDEIKALKEVKENTDKIIKAYILKDRINNEYLNQEIIYESRFCNVKLEEKIDEKTKYEIIKMMVELDNIDNLDIKSNIEVAKLISKDIYNSKDETSKDKYINYLLDYISYITRKNNEDLKEIKENLIKYLIDTENKNIKYINIKNKYDSFYNEIYRNTKYKRKIDDIDYKISILNKE